MAAPPWGVPPSGHGHGHGGNQQLAAPQPQGTAVAVTAASNGVGNPYVVVTPAPANPSPSVRAPPSNRVNKFDVFYRNSPDLGRCEFKNHRIYCLLFKNFKKIKISKNM
jgi:hypothetical protein